jgi:hypothetical protein
MGAPVPLEFYANCCRSESFALKIIIADLAHRYGAFFRPIFGEILQNLAPLIDRFETGAVLTILEYFQEVGFQAAQDALEGAVFTIDVLMRNWEKFVLNSAVAFGISRLVADFAKVSSIYPVLLERALPSAYEAMRNPQTSMAGMAICMALFSHLPCDGFVVPPFVLDELYAQYVKALAFVESERDVGFCLSPAAFYVRMGKVQPLDSLLSGLLQGHTTVLTFPNLAIALIFASGSEGVRRRVIDGLIDRFNRDETVDMRLAIFVVLAYTWANQGVEQLVGLEVHCVFEWMVNEVYRTHLGRFDVFMTYLALFSFPLSNEARECLTHQFIDFVNHTGITATGMVEVYFFSATNPMILGHPLYGVRWAEFYRYLAERASLPGEVQAMLLHVNS